MKAKSEINNFLRRYGISFNRPGLYELSSVFIPWYSGEFETNIEIEVVRGNKGRDYSVCLFLVPNAVGLVERTLAVAADFDNNFQFREMLIAKNIRENIIPDIKDLDFSKEYNAFLAKRPDALILTLTRILNQVSKKEFLDVTLKGIKIEP